MQFHNIHMQEYKQADDRTFLASMAKHLIRIVWEELFTLGMRLKLGLDAEEDEQDNQEREETEEQPPEAAEEQDDTWEAEEEAAR